MPAAHTGNVIRLILVCQQLCTLYMYNIMYQKCKFSYAKNARKRVILNNFTSQVLKHHEHRSYTRPRKTPYLLCRSRWACPWSRSRWARAPWPSWRPLARGCWSSRPRHGRTDRTPACSLPRNNIILMGMQNKQRECGICKGIAEYAKGMRKMQGECRLCKRNTDFA